MKKQYIALLPILLLVNIAPNVDAAPAPADAILSKDTWSHFDWGSPEQSALWKSLQWSSNADGSKVAPLTIFGGPYRAVWASDLLHIQPLGTTHPSCEELAPLLSTQFGKSVDHDSTWGAKMPITSGFTQTVELHEWTIGSTRIHAECTGLTFAQPQPNLPNSGMAWLVTISSVANLPALEATYELRCTRVIEGSGSDSRAMDDVEFWVDPTDTTIRNGAHELVSQTLMTPKVIAFKIDRGLDGEIYSIDRITGELSGKLRVGGMLRSNLHGQCIKAQ